jgi:SfnB family sulfur acquisition oxidoreductase
MQTSLNTASIGTSVAETDEDEAVPQRAGGVVQAHRITDESEAISVARRFAAQIASGAAARDRERRLPFEEVEQYSATGLLGLNVPRAYGGPGVSCATLGAVFGIIAEADPSIAQIPKNHFYALDILSLTGSEAQKTFFFKEVLAGKRIGQAASERGTKHAMDIKTRLTRTPGGLRLNGRKFYTTGVLFAHWIAVNAIDDDGRFVQVFVPRDSPGVEVIDDWTGFGQRTTASGTTELRDVPVDPDHVVPLQAAYEKPTLAGPVSQFLHAWIDAGMARAAIEEAIAFVNTRTRPWPDSGLARASEDPYIIQAIGDLKIRLFATEAALDRAAMRLDLTSEQPTEEEVAAASIDVACAKVLTTELAILAANKLFELSGASSTSEGFNLDRHWRNARTHTLHDPVRWKYNIVGDYYLNSVHPRRHNYI